MPGEFRTCITPISIRFCRFHRYNHASTSSVRRSTGVAKFVSRKLLGQPRYSFQPQYFNTPVPDDSLVTEPQSCHTRCRFLGRFALNPSTPLRVNPSTALPSTALGVNATLQSTPPTAAPSPHEDGRTVCLVCHQTGIAASPVVPAGHASYSDSAPPLAATCLTCHKREVTTPVIPDRPPRHPSTGCLSCHRTEGTATPPGDSHEYYSDVTPPDAALCLACHK